jgi:hypothetical protein
MKDWRPKLTAIDDPIADDHWSYRTEDGTKRTSRITIGRPALLSDGSHLHFVRKRFYEFEDVAPRAAPKAASKRSQAKKGRGLKKATTRRAQSRK